MKVTSLIGVVCGHDVRMRQLRGGLHFTVKTIHGFGFPNQSAIDDLQRHRAFHLAMAGLVDIAHSAFADQAENLVARMLGQLNRNVLI